MAEGTSSNYDEMELSEAVKFISENAKDVFINKENIRPVTNIVTTFMMDNLPDFYIYNNSFYRNDIYPQEDDHLRKADWLFVLNTLNFSLWYPKGTKQWKVEDAQGYFGLCKAIQRAIIRDNKPLWDPKYYATITRIELEHIFRSDDGETCIPLIDERVRILHEVGEILLKKYKGTFMECVKSSHYDADKLVKLLFDEFESYRDEVIYDGKKVRFLIKARSLVGDIWNKFKEKPIFNLNTKNMMSTTLVDYRIRQVFLKYEVLRYSDRLVNRFENSNEPLEYGSREEIEICGCILFVIKEICKEMQKISQRYIKEKPILKTKAFKVHVLADNVLLGLLFAGIEDKSLKEYPFYYTRSVYY